MNNRQRFLCGAVLPPTSSHSGQPVWATVSLGCKLVNTYCLYFFVLLTLLCLSGGVSLLPL